MSILGLVTPVWNGYRGVPGSTWFEQAIKSGISNMRDGYKYLILDNGSDDGTFEYLSKIAIENNLYILRTPSKLGLCPSLNIAIDILNCKYFAPLSSDDIMPDGHLERCVNYMEEHQDVVMCGGAPIWIDDNNNNLDLYSPNQTAPKTVDLWYEALINGQCFNVGPVYRTDVIKKLGKFDETTNPTAGEDYDMYMKICERGLPIKIFDEPGYYTRMRSSLRPSLSDNHQALDMQVAASFNSMKSRVGNIAKRLRAIREGNVFNV